MSVALALAAGLAEARRRGAPRSQPIDLVVRHSDLDQAPLPCDRTLRRKVDPGATFPLESVLDRVYPPR